MSKRKCKVFMFPTKSKSNIQLQMNGKLHLENGSSICLNSYQHIYIISDEKIENGDWYLSQDGKDIKISQCQGKEIPFLSKKIIATTDTSLISINEQYFDVNKSRKSAVLEQKTLPQIPQKFIQYYIEEYNKSNIITEVEVEYDCDHNQMPSRVIDLLKINLDNTINIKPSKDSWNKEEVKQLCKLAFKYHCDNSRTTSLPDKWIEENL